MKVLIKSARIICQDSPYNGQVMDIFLERGRIIEVAVEISKSADKIIEVSNLHVSIGWMDIFADFSDPGFEHRESLESGSAAAAAGGFTDVMIIPNTDPPVSSKSQVEYLIRKSATLPVTIHPIAGITNNTAGKELAEMFDMQASGAVAFSDGDRSIQNPGILLKAMQYVLPVDGTIIQVPDDKTLSNSGLMHEGIVSTRLGLPGKPAIAEELMISRDIELLRYTNSRLHITGVSTKKGLELVQRAKQEGLRLTVSVTAFHCFFCDEDLHGYNSNLKVNPPLRTREDMLAVREAFRNGTIDCIASHHFPRHWDDKNCEFEYAKNGMSTLESLFGVMNSFGKGTGQLIEMLTVTPRTIFNLAVPVFKEGEKACITMFDPERKYVFEKSMIKSKSSNNPFLERHLKGAVIGIINCNKVIVNNS